MNPAQPGEGGGTRLYRFGEITVDAAAHTLSRADVRQPIEPKAFAVLLALLEHPGELIGRDDLLDRVWGHRHVTPGVLTRAIAQLRHALDDDPHQARYIQTQHALGYRFVGELEPEVEATGLSELAGPAPEAVDSGHSEHPVPRPPAAAGTENNAAVDPAEAAGSQPTFEATRAQGFTERRKRLPRSRWRVAAGGLLLLSLGAWWLFGHGPASPQRADASIAVLPFTTLSDSRSDHYFAEGLAVELQAALAGVPGVKVAARVSPEVLSRTRDGDIRTLGRTLGVATVLDASVRREADRVRVDARLSDTQTGFTLWTKRYDRDMSEVFAVQAEVADDVVKELLGVLPVERNALNRRLQPTASAAAYDAYLKGVGQMQRTDTAEDFAGAAGYFNQALAADAGFARAQAGICRIEIHRFEAARDAAAYDRAQAACRRAETMDPELRESSLAFADLHRVRGESARAIEHYSKALEDPALAADANLGIAKTHGANDRQQLALDYFERARVLRPGDGDIHRELAYQHYLNGDIELAIASYRKATELQPGEARAWSGLGGMYLASGRRAEAVAALQRSLRIKPSYGVLSNLGTLRYQSGEYAEAARLYRQAAALRPEDYRNWGNLGDALSAGRVGDFAARDMYQRALDLGERYARIKSDDAQALAALGWYRANLGEHDAARELVLRAEALDTERGEVALWAAQTFALLGDPDQARTRLARARREGIDEDRIQASPLLRDPALRDVADTAGEPRSNH